MPLKPYCCEFGHEYFENQAKALGFVCDRDNSPIVKTGPAASASDAEQTEDSLPGAATQSKPTR